MPKDPEWDNESFGAWDIFRRMFSIGEAVLRDRVYREARKSGVSHQDAYLKARQTKREDLPDP